MEKVFAKNLDGYSVYDMPISVEEWKTILQDPGVSDEQKDALIKFYNEPGHSSTCTIIAKKYSIKFEPINALVMNFGKVAKKVLNRYDAIGSDGHNTYFPFPVGKGRNTKEGYEWTLRPELAQAMEELNIVEMKFKWIPFYEEFAAKLLQYKNDRSGLMELIRSMGEENTKYLHNDDRTPMIDVDPFTVMGIFNRGSSWKSRTEMATFFKEKLSIAAIAPDNFDGIPVLDNHNSIIPGANAKKEVLDALWKLFEIASDYSNPEFDAVFDYLEGKKQIRANLTMGLYWIHPYDYISLDSTNVKYLNYYRLPQPDVINAESYKHFLNDVLNRMKSGDIPCCSIPELSLAAWKFNYPPYWLVGFSFGKEDSQKDRFIKDGIWEGGVKKNDKKQNERLKAVNEGDYLILKSLGTKDPDHKTPFLKVSGIGKVLSKNNVAPKVEDENFYQFSVNYINTTAIDFDGKEHTANHWDTIDYADDKMINDYAQAIIDDYHPMKEYDKYVNLLKANHNLILTGAPGTGKTFLAKQIAKAMNPDDVPGFVQFHPSFDYTDFVEGLRPSESNQNGEISFELKDGIFKEFCKVALENLRNSQKTKEEFNKEQRVKKEVKDFLMTSYEKASVFQTKSGTQFKIRGYDESKILIHILNDVDIHDISSSIDDVIDLLVQDVPLVQVGDVGAHFNRSFGTQQDSYTFSICQKIREIQKDSGPLVVTDDEKLKNYVFIIDEINRGEISKIFGELFYSIDPDYRGQKGKVKTQYENIQSEAFDRTLGPGWFYVPENVYIIGTMNDIDRSVESMDFAMRRRFTWIEVKAEDRIAMWDDPDDGIADWKDDALKRMKALNAAIEKVDGLSSAYDIGPAYFLKLKQCNGDFNLLWKYHLEGLLKEYLRGMPDADKKLEELHKAYNPKDEEKQSGPAQLEQPVEAEVK